MFFHEPITVAGGLEHPDWPGLSHMTTSRVGAGYGSRSEGNTVPQRKTALRNGKEGNMVQVTQLPYSNDLESAIDMGSGRYFNKFIDINFYEFITYRKYCNLVVQSFSLVPLFETLWTAAH